MIKYLEYDSNFDELEFLSDGDDLIVSCEKTNTQDRVKNLLATDSFMLFIKTNDNSVCYRKPDDIQFNIFAKPNDEGIYSAVGSKVKDFLIGSEFDDLITSNQGDDIIYGLGGNDTFIFNKGDGTDKIMDAKNGDSIHINSALDNLQYNRSENDLIISYSDSDKIVLADFFKNKSADNIDLIKNLDGETQAEYEDYINNPPYEIRYYHGMPEKVYYLKLFMSEEGYELCEKSILKNALISVGEKDIYNGTDYNENVIATGQNSKFNLGIGSDVINYETGFKKSLITLNKGENVNLKFEEKPDFDYKISGKNLILTSADKDVITLKNYMTYNRDINVSVNGKSIKSEEKYLEMLKADAGDFKKGKFTGTVLSDVIDASEYKSKKKGVVIKSKSGSDKVTGSLYNDTITVSSIDGDRTTVIERGGKNTIKTGKGRDEISVYGDSSNTISAGEGKNVITLSSTGKNKYTGGNGIERVTVTDGTNNINMKNGYNTIDISGGKNTVVGGKDYDVVNVTGGENKISTGGGYDKISLMGGNNTVYAGDGNNSIKVSGGDAVIYGGSENDYYDFMNYYNMTTNQFDGHVDIIDSKGANELSFYDQMQTFEKITESDNGLQSIMARLDGRPIVYFDVSISKKGETVVGKDILFTLSRKFTGFDGNGVHVSDMNSIARIEAVHLEALYYMSMYSEYGTDPLDPEEPYYRPNYGEYASSRYTLDVTELSEKVASWLTSDSNTSGYKSAMEVFTKGSEAQIQELSAIYADNSVDCYVSIR